MTANLEESATMKSFKSLRSVRVYLRSTNRTSVIALTLGLLLGCGKAADKPAPQAETTGAPRAAEPSAAAAGGPAAAAPGAVVGSCLNPSKTTCTDYVGATATVDTVKPMCDAISGAFTAASACPADKRLGKCSMEAMGKRLSFYPGDDNLTVALAQDECKSVGGAWAP